MSLPNSSLVSTSRLRAALAWSLACVLALGACGSDDDLATPPPVPGVTFVYPRDGQVDVPVGARLIVQLTGEISEAALAAPCSTTGPEVQGSVCVVGPGGVAAHAATIVGPRRNILLLSPELLAPGETYRLYVRPPLLDGAANLPASAPLVTFRTRQAERAAGAPALLTVNGEPAASFTGGEAPRRPILDRSTLRLVFSEALDERTVTASSVVLRRVGTPTAVAATVLAKAQHLVIDPTTDLLAQERYELVLTGLTDRGGAALPATTLAFTPGGGATYEQVVELDQPGSPSGPGDALSELTGVPINSVDKRSLLIGRATLGLLPGTLRAELGDPKAFGGPIPFTVRKGQSLRASELPLRLAGIIGLGAHTGDLRFEILTDANGWVSRNRLRPAEQRPDDLGAPLEVELFLDAALIAEDGTGQALATQTLLGLHLVGLATSASGQLALEVAGALEVDLLGVASSHADLSLRLRTGATPLVGSETPPTVVSASPARGASGVATDARLQVVLSSAVDLGRVRQGGQLTLTTGATAVPITVRAAGGALLVQPNLPLAAGTAYTLTLGPLHDVAGRPIELATGDATGGTGVISFTTAAPPGGATVPPQLAAAVPGAPCALVGGTATTPGHCDNGASSDPSYRPFELAADRPIELWFTQPMSAASLRVGTACGSGAIRVELLNAAGACAQAVPGALEVRTASVRFTPTQRWQAGARYRLVLNAGGNGSCDADEVCGANGRPLNTDPLDAADGSGGPQVILPFTALPPQPHTMIPLTAAPWTDRNGNGFVDANEALTADNQLGIEVASTSGIVSAASLGGPDCFPARPGTQVCIGVSTELPVTVLPQVESCPVTATGAPATGAGPCVPVRISAQTVRVTSLTINATATIAGQDVDIRNVQTGLMHLRLLEPAPAGAVGHILDDGTGTPVFVIKADTLMDAPDLSILAGLVSHDVASKPVSLTLAGPVTFTSEGRMRVTLHNVGDVLIPVNLSAVFDGRITLRVPSGALTLSLLTPPSR